MDDENGEHEGCCFTVLCVRHTVATVLKALRRIYDRRFGRGGKADFREILLGA